MPEEDVMSYEQAGDILNYFLDLTVYTKVSISTSKPNMNFRIPEKLLMFWYVVSNIHQFNLLSTQTDDLLQRPDPSLPPHLLSPALWKMLQGSWCSHCQTDEQLLPQDSQLSESNNQQALLPATHIACLFHMHVAISWLNTDSGTWWWCILHNHRIFRTPEFTDLHTEH